MHNQGAKHHMQCHGKISLLLLRKLTYQRVKHGSIAVKIIIQSNQTFDIVGFVHGGGCNGQAEALCLSISKSLAVIDLDTRKLLKEQRLLQTDSRVVERKKYGLKKARKASQYSKR